MYTPVGYVQYSMVAMECTRPSAAQSVVLRLARWGDVRHTRWDRENCAGDFTHAPPLGD